MGQMPPPFICYHPRNRWIAEGSGSWSMRADGTVKSEHRTTGYHCGICWTWIPADAIPWPTDKEVMERLDSDIVRYKDAFDRMADS
jgi:hypothetical protein